MGNDKSYVFRTIARVRCNKKTYQKNLVYYSSFIANEVYDPEKHDSVHLFGKSQPIPNAGTYLIIDVHVSDTHGQPTSHTQFVTVERVPAKSRLHTVSAAQAVFV